MTFDEALQDNGPNGKAIIGRLVAFRDGRKDIRFRDTEGGFHLCLELVDEEIPLIQVWGRSDNEPTNQIIETRKQYFPDHLGLSKDEEKAIFIMFRNANFKQTTGHFLNLRLSYSKDKDPYLKIGPTQLDNIEKALKGTIVTILSKGK